VPQLPPIPRKVRHTQSRLCGKEFLLPAGFSSESCPLLGNERVRGWGGPAFPSTKRADREAAQRCSKQAATQKKHKHGRTTSKHRGQICTPESHTKRGQGARLNPGPLSSPSPAPSAGPRELQTRFLAAVLAVPASTGLGVQRVRAGSLDRQHMAGAVPSSKNRQGLRRFVSLCPSLAQAGFLPLNTPTMPDSRAYWSYHTSYCENFTCRKVSARKHNFNMILDTFHQGRWGEDK